VSSIFLLIFFLVVGSGGLLFEYFLLLHVSKKQYTVLCAALESKRTLTLEEQGSLREEHKLTFWFDSIRVFKSLNRKCSKPLALWTMLQEYRGLSRTGCMLSSTVHASLPISTYDTHKEKLRTDYIQLLNNYSSENSALVTIDNYNHFYNSASLTLPGTRETQYIICNYTVAALIRFEHSLSSSFPFVEVRPLEYMDSFPSKLSDLTFYSLQVVRHVPRVDFVVGVV
jgi:hypothetical protein